MINNAFAHSIQGQPSSDIAIQIHGGAWDIPPQLQAAHRQGVLNAFEHAVFRLKQGIAPLDVVTEVLEILENDPVFDAGTGSFLNEHGVVELDAALMEGEGLRAGAVAAIGNYANPSRIAKAVMEHTEHVLLVGQGAEEFAAQQGFRKVRPADLVQAREIAAHQAWLLAGKPDAKIFFAHPDNQSLAGQEPERRGTVGIVLGLRKEGDKFSLFSGTSTGGTPGKRAGRVGDVPLVGCGLYADNEGAAVSCTGWGEGLIRLAAAKAVSMRVSAGAHPEAAVSAVLRDMWRRTGGRGGIIAIDYLGRCGAGFSTPDMAFAGPKCEPLVFGSSGSSI